MQPLKSHHEASFSLSHNNISYWFRLSPGRYNENLDCSIVKKGTFKYLDIPDTTAYFKLKKENHTEYHRDGKYYIKSKVKWVTGCQYEMKMLENTIPDFPFQPGAVMLVTIIKIEGDIIYYSSEVEGDKWYGRLQKLE